MGMSLWCIQTRHHFQKKRGAKSYKLFGILEGYDDNDDVVNEDKEDKWEEWFHDCAIKCIAAY